MTVTQIVVAVRAIERAAASSSGAVRTLCDDGRTYFVKGEPVDLNANFVTGRPLVVGHIVGSLGAALGCLRIVHRYKLDEWAEGATEGGEPVTPPSSDCSRGAVSAGV